jgi:hypothetical protein
MEGAAAVIDIAESPWRNSSEDLKEFLVSAPDTVLEIDRPATPAQTVELDPYA